jgi:catechol 2,3-dioxygenase-like lactoylglutathione lyase family enzyme
VLLTWKEESAMPTVRGAVYAHTNLIARDWRRLAAFYEEVFGCVPVPPERDLSGPWLEAGAGVEGAHIRGMHLRLPGTDGPTLEIFQYGSSPEAPRPEANHLGFMHLAFRVDDVEEAVQAVLGGGGSRVGPLVSREVPGAGLLSFAYVRDPEGNLLELQRWN